MTRLGPNATHEMITECWYQIHEVEYGINPDDVMPFIHSAEHRRLGTTRWELAAAGVLLSFTRSEQAVDEEMIRGIRELQQARAHKIMAEEEVEGN